MKEKHMKKELTQMNLQIPRAREIKGKRGQSIVDEKMEGKREKEKKERSAEEAMR